MNGGMLDKLVEEWEAYQSEKDQLENSLDKERELTARLQEELKEAKEDARVHGLRYDVLAAQIGKLRDILGVPDLDNLTNMAIADANLRYAAAHPRAEVSEPGPKPCAGRNVNEQ